MKAIKLTPKQYQRSLKSRINHLLLYSENGTKQRTNNNSIFGCLVCEYNGYILEDDIEKIFGKGIYIKGSVMPEDKENINVDVYYIKGLVKQSIN